MARIRTIKPEFWTNEKLSALPEFTHMLAGSLLNYSDDEGYFNANLGLVKAACFPLREPSVSPHEAFKQLSGIGYLRFGTAPDGRVYGRVVEFSQHQSISRPTPSKIKGLEILWESSVNTHGALIEDSTPEQGTGNREQGKGTGSKEPPPSAPARKAREKKTAITLEAFIAACRRDGQEPIPESDPVFKYADSISLPHQFLELAWLEFRARAKQKGKRQANWRQTFQNAVRDNWYRLWWDNGGEWQLTTAGVQAQRAAKAAA